jgi:uncharacterized protein
MISCSSIVSSIVGSVVNSETSSVSSWRRRLLSPVLALGLLSLLGCGSSPPVTEVATPAPESTTASIDVLLDLASGSSGVTASEYAILALENMLDEGLTERAQQVAEQVDQPDTLPAELQLRYAMVRARLALTLGQAEQAESWLPATLVENSNNVAALQLLGNIYVQTNQPSAAVLIFSQVFDTSEASSTRASSPPLSLFDDMWLALNRLDDNDLSSLAAAADSYELRGWIELIRVYRADQFSMRSQLDAITQWQRIWAQHAAAAQLPTALVDLQLAWESRPRHIALILPSQQPAGNAIQEGFLSAYYQALGVSREVPRISVFDSSNSVSVYPIYDQAVASGADLIIGPLNKEFVNQLQQLPALPVPTLALNYADNQQSIPANLYQFGLAPEDEISRATTLAWQQGYRNASLVTPRSSDYVRLQTLFADNWSSLGGKLVSEATFSGDSDYGEVIKNLLAIDSSEARATRLLDLLPRNNLEFTPRRREDIDFIFLIANPRQGRQLKPTLAFYFAEDIPVISLPSINDGLDNPSEDRDLDGIVFSDAPWILDDSDPLKNAVGSILRRAQGPLQRLRALGIDSFRLYGRLPQLQSGQIESLVGTTGVLSMTGTGRIYRKLPLAQFVNGSAIPYEPQLRIVED